LGLAALDAGALSLATSIYVDMAFLSRLRRR